MIFLLYLPIPIGIQSGGNERDLPYPFVWHHSVCIRLVTLLSIKSAYTRSMQLKQLHRRAVNRYAPFRFAQESATASVFSLSLNPMISPYLVSLVLSRRMFVVALATVLPCPGEWDHTFCVGYSILRAAWQHDGGRFKTALTRGTRAFSV
jgi:hypothetical protein